MKYLKRFNENFVEFALTPSDKEFLAGKIFRLHNIPIEYKTEATKLIQYITKAQNSLITGLELHPLLNEKIKKYKLPSGFSMGVDKDGYFIHTHRARSKSYPTPDGVTVEEIEKVDSSG